MPCRAMREALGQDAGAGEGESLVHSVMGFPQERQDRA